MALTGIGREPPFNARGVATGIWTLIFRAMGAGALAAVLVLVFGVVFAAWQIRRSWREEPPPVWVQAFQSYLCTPKFWLKFFKRWMRWKIERNPIGWLEQRRWTGRLVTWTWFAIVISIYSAVFSDRNFFRDFSGFQLTIGWLMMLSIASSAAGSFRRERESGVLELLLVTPMTTNQIIGGRLRGLWGQFLPAIGCLLGIWLYFARILQTNENLEFVAVFAGLFLTLPIFGLYFSLRCRHFVSAFLLTIAVGLFPGWLIVLGIVVGLERIGLRLQPFQTVGVPISMMAAVQFTLAAVCLKALWRRLNTRSFPMERTAA